mgnify:CR=1 FL=1
MIPLVTVDTNVLVSAGTISNTPPAQILDAWRIGRIELALSIPILQEVRAVLQRPYFVETSGWSKKKIDLFVSELQMGALVVGGNILVDVCRDPKDNMIFSCAVEASSNYIVSGDEDVLAVGNYRNIRVMSPRRFVDEILTT